MVDLSKDRQMAILERYTRRMIYGSQRNYLQWLEHHYPDVRAICHKAGEDHAAATQEPKP